MKISILLSFLLSAAIAKAEIPGQRIVIPEKNPGGKLLTQEDVVGGSWGSRLKLPEKYRDKKAEPHFYSRDGSLWFASAEGEILIAGSEEDGIVFGDAVSRNEFGINGGIFPSPSGSKVAFYRKDERRVGLFPLMDIRSRTGRLEQLRYPMNGMESEQLSVGIYDTLSRRTVWIRPDDFDEERYLTGISWSPDEESIYIQVLARSQHDMHLNAYRSADGSFKRTILTEHNDAWVEPLDPLRFPEGRNDYFIYRTDNRDGWRNLYLCDTLGKNVTRLTGCDADVSFVKCGRNELYYCSAEVSPVENHLFRLPFTISGKGKVRTGKPQLLTPEAGWHRIRPFGDGFIDSWSAPQVPGRCVLRDKEGKITEDIKTAADPLEDFAACEVVLGCVKSADGSFDNYFRLIKPLGWTPERKYPVIHYVYGGPHSQMVTDAWLGNIRMWEMLMAQRGYVVYVQDNRGTQNRGAAFEKAINRRCGQAEMEDQVAGLTALLREPWVDEERVGVYGWSYGGFMAISLLTHYPQIYKAGVAGGPVIDWKWYEVMYGERYMDTPETNPEGFARTSLIPRAENLQGKLLVMQGQLDKTVLNINSLSFIQACVENGKLPDYFPYPCSEHNVFGIWRAQMNAKITAFFDENL